MPAQDFQGVVVGVVFNGAGGSFAETSVRGSLRMLVLLVLFRWLAGVVPAAGCRIFSVKAWSAVNFSVESSMSCAVPSATTSGSSWNG